MKVPVPKKLPSGRWRVQYMTDGVRGSQTFDTEIEAKAFAAGWKAGVVNADPVSELSVGKAIDRYIESKDGVLSPSTIAAYKRIRKNHLQDIMNVKLRALTQERVQRAVNAMTKEGKSPKTVRNAHGLLSATLAEYRPGMVLRTTLPQKIRYEAAVPSEADIKAILAALPGSEIELPVTIAIWLGLRMSEILGLRWGDIDKENKILHVRRAQVDEGVKTTKTYLSQRDLPLPDHIADLMGEPGKKDAPADPDGVPPSVRGRRRPGVPLPRPAAHQRLGHAGPGDPGQVRHGAHGPRDEQHAEDGLPAHDGRPGAGLRDPAGHLLREHPPEVICTQLCTRFSRLSLIINAG